MSSKPVKVPDPQKSDGVPPDPKREAADLNSQGLTLKNQGKYEEALQCFDKALDLDPQSTRALFEKGGVCETLGHLSDAIRSYEKVLQIDPQYAAAWNSVGICMLNQNRVGDALRCFDKVISLNPKYARAWYGKGKCLRILGRLDEGIEALDKALQYEPRHADAWNNVGLCLHEKREYEDALGYFDEALKIDPRNQSLWNNKGLSLLAWGRYAEAIVFFDKALGFGQVAATWYNKGQSLEKLGQEADALTCYAKAIEMRTEFPDALFAKASLEAKLGRKQEAEHTFKQFLVFASPKDSERIKAVQQWLQLSGKATAGEPAQKPESAVSSIVWDLIPQKYEVKKVLGKGGFGEVYLVSSLETKDVYLLKTFREEFLEEPAAKFLFRKETKAWIDLGAHPQIVRAHFVDELGGRPLIAVEYVAPNEQGLNTLEGYLQHCPPDHAQSLQWAIQCCSGMEYAYSKGIRCHRDIRPANILIGQDQTVKITDFGLANVLGMFAASGIRISIRDGKVGLSFQNKEGSGFGAPTHMSPEQFLRPGACDERSDIYSFGIVLYQMASGGKLPFIAPLPKDSTEEECLRFWKAMQLLHKEAICPDLESPLLPMIRRCLEKDPANRYQSFKELRSELELLSSGSS